MKQLPEAWGADVMAGCHAARGQALAAISLSGSRCTGLQFKRRRAAAPLSRWSSAWPLAQSPSSAAIWPRK